jgi:hypothetical protein
VAADATLTSVGVPAFLSDHVKDLLQLSAVECHTWDRPDIASGNAPMTLSQAIDNLKAFDDLGIYAMAPSVVQSPLSKQQMINLCAQLFTSEWYARRELLQSGVHVPENLLTPILQEMTRPDRKMSDEQKQMALSYRATLLKEE